MTIHPSVDRRTITRLGLGGLVGLVAGRARPAGAQDGTPVLPDTVPPELEAWAAGWEVQDPAQMVTAYADEAVLRVVPFDTVHEGAPAIEASYAAFFGAFAEATATIGTMFATAQRAAAEWFFAGRYTGPLPGLPAGRGEAVALRGATILQLRDGRIAQEALSTDLAGLLVQIGVLDPTVPGVEVPATPAG